MRLSCGESNGTNGRTPIPVLDIQRVQESSLHVFLTSPLVRLSRLRSGQWFMLIAALLVVAAGVGRYAKQPTFWLDEAFVAVSLRNPSFPVIFAPLEYGQYFPRVYLTCIAMLRELLGYRIWALRLLPSLSFAVGTVFWAGLLVRRAGKHLLLGLLGGALLIGSSFWLEQAVQLKQYTLDVVLALVPFLLNDRQISEQLGGGRRKPLTAMLALGCIISYTYPIALGARLLGWYAFRGKRDGWRLDRSAIFTLISTLGLAVVAVWMTDYRYNLVNREAYLEYWQGCIIHFNQGINAVARPIGKLLWGWHGRMPLLTLGIVPLQALGLYRVVKTWRNAKEADDPTGWGSRSLSGVLVLLGVIIASAAINYPLCGRVVLFTEVHTQILALEGVLFVLTSWRTAKTTRFLAYGFTAIVLICAAGTYLKFNRAAQAEDLRTAISLINPEVANTIWVHPCSVAQVRALPGALSPARILLGQDVDDPVDGSHRMETASEALEQWRESLHPCTLIQLNSSAPSLPIERVLSEESRGNLQKGKKAWVVWSHLGAEFCRESFDEIRRQARSWEVIYEAADGGLALAEF